MMMMLGLWKMLQLLLLLQRVTTTTAQQRTPPILRQQPVSVLTTTTTTAFVFLILTVNQVTTVAFPNYLQTRSNCFTELSTDEVIMNHPVIAAADSDDVRMRIQPVINNNENNNEQLYRLSPDGTTVHVRTEFPVQIPLQVMRRTSADDDQQQHANSNKNMDYQWAMDVVSAAAAAVGGGAGAGQDEEKDEHHVSWGSFETTGACEGKVRVAARSTDTVVVTVHQSGAAVVAAWAASFEAVRLTPPLYFVREEHADHSDHSDPAELIAAAVDSERKVLEEEEPAANSETGPEKDPGEEEPVKEERGNNIPETGPEAVRVDPQTLVDETLRRQVHGIKAQLELHQNKILKEQQQRGGGDERRSPREPRQRHNADEQQELEPHGGNGMQRKKRANILRDRRDPRAATESYQAAAAAAAASKNHNKNGGLLHYDIGFHLTGGLSVYSYVQGALLLLIAPVVATYLLLWCSRRAAGKGRREL